MRVIVAVFTPSFRTGSKLGHLGRPLAGGSLRQPPRPLSSSGLQRGLLHAFSRWGHTFFEGRDATLRFLSHPTRPPFGSSAGGVSGGEWGLLGQDHPPALSFRGTPPASGRARSSNVTVSLPSRPVTGTLGEEGSDGGAVLRNPCLFPKDVSSLDCSQADDLLDAPSRPSSVLVTYCTGFRTQTRGPCLCFGAEPARARGLRVDTR